MKTWDDLTDKEKQNLREVVYKFFQILELTILDPVGDVLRDVIVTVVGESLDKAAEKVLKKSKEEKKDE